MTKKLDLFVAIKNPQKIFMPENFFFRPKHIAKQ